MAGCSRYSLRLVAVTCEGKGAPTRWLKVHTGNYARAEEERAYMGDGIADGTGTYGERFTGNEINERIDSARRLSFRLNYYFYCKL